MEIELKKLQKYNLISALIVCLVLLFQMSVVKHFVWRFLWAPTDYIMPLFEDRLGAVIQERVIISVIAVVLLIVIEWVLFFVIGTKLWNRLKVETTEFAWQKYQAWLVLVALIVSAVMLVSITFIAVTGGLTVSKLLSEVGAQSVENIQHQIETLVKTTEFNNLADIEMTFTRVVETIKENSPLYTAVVRAFSSINTVNMIHRLWYAIVLLGCGINAGMSGYYFYTTR